MHVQTMGDEVEIVTSKAEWTDFEGQFEKVASKKPRRSKTDTSRNQSSKQQRSDPSSRNEKTPQAATTNGIDETKKRSKRTDGSTRSSSVPHEQRVVQKQRKQRGDKPHKENRSSTNPPPGREYSGIPKSPEAKHGRRSSFVDLPLQISTKVHKYDGSAHASRNTASPTRRRTSDSRDDQSEGGIPNEVRGRKSTRRPDSRTRDKSSGRQSVTSSVTSVGRHQSKTTRGRSESRSKESRGRSLSRISVNTNVSATNKTAAARSRHPPLTKENFKHTTHSRTRSASLSRINNLAEYESPTKASSRSRRPPSTFKTRQELPKRSRAVSEGDQAAAGSRSQHSRSSTDPNIRSYISFDSSEISGGTAGRLMKKGNVFIEKLFGNPVSRPAQNTVAGSLGNEIRPRILLAATVYHNTATNLWITTINTNQRGVAKNPATANKFLKAFSFPTEREARESAIANAPPKMVPFNESPVCFCCKGKFAVFRRAGHCRNCGVCTCSCCSTTWPSRMLPATYNLKHEAQVRVCVSCNALSNSFKKALLDGDLEEAVALYGTGNVNLRTPFPISAKKDEVLYPIHCAAEGGNLGILRWLIDDHFCPVKIHRSAGTKKVKRAPLDSMIVTSRGRTALSIALENTKVDIIRYLVVECGASIYETKDLKPALRALEASLFAIPSNANTICDRPCTPHSTRWDHASFDEFSEPSSLGADEHFGGDDSLVSQSNRSTRSQGNSRGGGDSCIICFDRKINCVATPCGHQVCCLVCSTNLVSCPVCNDKTSFIKIFRP